jgi:secreted PhoX family phosphatase
MSSFEVDDDCNPSSNPSLQDLLDVAVSRRRLLQGALGTAALGFLSPKALLAQSASLLAFESVAVSQEDAVRIPDGYTAEVLYAWGDPISDGPKWDPNAGDDWQDQERQAGMHHDGIHFFPLPMGSGSSNRGLLVLNHEYTDEGLLHQGGLTPVTADKVRKSQAAHGVSVIEVAFDGKRWSVVRPSALARRITGYTPMGVDGPAAGSSALRTTADPAGTRILGTLNNCAMGYTPWGTYLACEENFNQYFGRGGNNQNAEQRRYGLPAAASERRWEEFDGRFDASREPNEFNRFGWVVEIDPFDPGSTPVKHTALGRVAHESATVTLAADGRAVVYTGDDSRNEYIYKFVSRNRYSAADRASNFRLLSEGTLYAARFNTDGSGEWRELTLGVNGLDAASGFASQADVVVKARLAADRVGATKMDRPEWIAVHPQSKDVCVTLTNNSTRGASGGPAVDPANPRANNVYGHIVRWVEAGSDPAALTFRWNIFVLAGDPRQTDAAKRGNIKGDAFGSPDGLWFDGRGVLWIETDISTSVLNTGDYANIGNNMMLAADPATGQIRRFLTGPRGCEITGVIMTPDMRTMFINIQHPGEPSAGDSNPNNTAAISTWPDGPGIGRPRSATVVIRKSDGGVIGG